MTERDTTINEMDTPRTSGSAMAVKPHQAPAGSHNQFIKDPVAHFRAIPWCAALLSDPAILDVIVVDRRPLPSGESNFVRRTMNSGTTVRACATFFRMLQPPRGKQNAGAAAAARPVEALSRSKELLKGGGPSDGEDPRNPFLLFNALLDLGEDLCGFASTMHGGLFAVLMDEVMGTAANFQAGKNVISPFFSFGDFSLLAPGECHLLTMRASNYAEKGAYTVQFNTKFIKAVKLPQVVLVRGRVVKRDGRKIFVRGAIEDKDGEFDIYLRSSFAHLKERNHLRRLSQLLDKDEQD